MKRHSQKGVALVITLILLSVITFMAVTFLVVSRHEGSAVNTFSQQSNAKFAADQALQSALGRIAGQMLATSNGLNFGLLVSTNYVQPFYTNIGFPAITNVSYYYQNGSFLSPADLSSMVANLQILPRAPVFVTTNKSFPPDFRFYLDLNRNGMYDPSFLGTDINGNLVNYMGDPEWIGILNHPNFPHSSSNQFIGRYAVFAVPVGNSEDLNYIHNQNKVLIGALPQFDGFIRNQGVGSWEINLAGFLSALNTNYWQNLNGLYNYTYTPTTVASSPLVSSAQSIGPAFEDASSILQFRYNGTLGNLNAFTYLFGTPASTLYADEYIDGYGVGPLMLGTSSLTTNYQTGYVSRPWSGDDCPNPFFSTQDLFSPAPVMAAFSNRLYSAGISTNTGNAAVNNYNRYTFYRLFSQMGFNSAPEPAPYPHSTKLNLNYMDVNGYGATNFAPWPPLTFFMNAANAMMTNAGFPFTVTNIPIYPVNYYTPAVHRLLQLAANIYDASTNKSTTAPNSFDYPSVFRPTFGRIGTNIFINGYVEVTNNDLSYNNGTYTLPGVLSANPPNLLNVNIYGVPWVIGARKGFPNFNAFSMESVCQMTRKLQVLFQKQTNTQYTLGVSNLLGVEAWNSYSNAYPRGVRIFGLNSCTMVLTNELGILTSNTVPSLMNTSIGPGQWPGFPSSPSANTRLIAASFQVPLLASAALIPGSQGIYHPFSLPHFNGNTNFDLNAPAVTYFGLNVTNRMIFTMIDQATGRVIDYVSLDGMIINRNITDDLAAYNNGGDGGIWLTNITAGQFQGVARQLAISEGQGSLYGFPPNGWTSDSLAGNSQSNGVSGFLKYITGGPSSDPPHQAPFTPTAVITYLASWQANDPLVHYTLSDLTPMPPIATNLLVNYPILGTAVTLTNLGQAVNRRYSPWALPGSQIQLIDSVNFANLAVKDPQITRSDDWQFPNNKYPNIGWLGRVHRGTPWQTVYLKSPGTDMTNWTNWTGNQAASVLTVNGANYVVGDAQITHPTNDWKILDLFTTAINANASKGQLSVNQTNLASWAAVLDGVFVLTNQVVPGNPNPQPLIIDPSDLMPTSTGSSVSTVQNIVSNMNTIRGTNAGGVFTSVGQILSVPQLTVASPYINTNVVPGTPAANLLSDAVYERIPQQILSLLRVGTPRYVIFAYGQSLKPADHSIVQSGPNFGLCTNYQITGEAATRTLIRIENHPIPGVTNGSPRAVIEQYNVMPPGN